MGIFGYHGMGIYKRNVYRRYIHFGKKNLFSDQK
jgi:hypothetical protein